MKHSFVPAFLLSCAVTLCAGLSPAGEAVTSADFAGAWNSGLSPISVKGVPIPEIGANGIVLENYLNTFTGGEMNVSGANGVMGNNAGTNALKLGSSSLVFMPGWDYPLTATIRNLALYSATNGAVSYTGNGTGAHRLSIDGVSFYDNAGGGAGGAVNVQTQMQSNAANSYTLNNSDFASNSAANGGAVALATNNSIFTSGVNTFSVTGDTAPDASGTAMPVHLFGFNRATAGNGGGVYFMGNNALGVRNEFISQGYAYFQNGASGLGGAIYNGVLNGNGPSANNFTLTGNIFIENQAGSGGAVATTINGGSTNVNVTLDGIFEGNIASANGGAVYTAVGDQYSPYGGTIQFDIGGLFDSNRAANGGVMYNDLRPGQSNVTVNVVLDSGVSAGGVTLPTMFLNNTVSGKGGAIYNTSGNNNPGTAVVNIADGVNFQGNTAASGGAIYNDGNGVINLNTAKGGAGIQFIDNSASSAANGADIYQASETAVINIVNTTDTTYSLAETESVDVNGGIAGVGTINQKAGTILNLGEKSQSIGFKGTFNQAAGAKLNASGLMFGGANNIGGTLNVHNGLTSVYFNANMLSNSRMNYSNTATERVSIGAASSDSAPGIQFKGSGATVNFTKEGFYNTSPPNMDAPRALFTLERKIDNGQANTIEFAHSDVTFGSTDFTGATNYTFWDSSVINLAGPLAPYQQYTFGTLTTNGDSPLIDSSSLLSLRVGNDPGSLRTDTISVLAGGGVLDLGRVYVNDANGALSGRSRVIYGDALKFENGRTQYVSTTSGTYQITTVDDQYIQFANTVAAAVDGNTGTTVHQDGSTTTTTDHSDTGGGSTTTTTTTNGGATIDHTDDTGSKTTVTINPDGSATITDNTGTQTVVAPGTTETVGNVTVDRTGGDTVTTVDTPGGSRPDSTTTVTTSPGGSGSTVANPDGTTTGTTINGGGARGITPTLTRPVLTLNDVNTLDTDAVNAGMTTAVPRGFQIGKGETYKNAADLDPMEAGTFSVYGAADGTGEAVLSGLNATTGAKQSLFDMQTPGTTFRLENLTVQDAAAADGGAVLNMNDGTSTAMLNTLTVQRNDATGGSDGGAVLVQAGTLLSTNVNYDRNTAEGNGGAIATTGTGNTTVRGGSFTNNTAGGDGGAIYNASPAMEIDSGTSLTFTGNRAAGDGGAIYNATDKALTLIADSYATEDPDDGAITFSGNTANGKANDIHNNGMLIFTGSGGTITIEGGISGTGAIRKEGESKLILGTNADNSTFTGTFEQPKGETDVNGTFFGGTSTITGGTLNWNPGAEKRDTATLQITDGGTINIPAGSILRLANPDDLIAREAATNLYGNIDLAGGTVYLSTQDQLRSPDGDAGTVRQSDGSLILSGTGMVVPAGGVTQTGGVIRVEKEATFVLDGAPGGSLAAGDLVITNATVSTNGHAFNYGAGGGAAVRTSGSLAMGDDALLNSADGVLQTHTFTGKFGIFSDLGTTPRAQFSVDLDAQAFQSDIFVFNGGTATSGVIVGNRPGAGDDITAMPGTVILSGIHLLNSPAVTVVPFTIMSAAGGIRPNITFASGMNEVDAPIGQYSLLSLGGGNYELHFLRFSPRAYRGQVATLAAVSAQSYVNNLLFEHVHLDSFDRAEDGRPAPWQFVREGRGLWAKPYYSRETLPFGGDVGRVENDVYGVVLGMDFPAMTLAGGWKFLPTVFAAYNGGRQDFPDVETVRTGGQGGFMGTFSHGDFAASVMGYGGGYRNDMKVGGYRDRPNSWFAGGAAKAAYTIHAGENLIFQPYALASFNWFDGRKWRSEYGSITMEAGGYRGWNVAPGMAVAYNRGEWSVHASAHYMFNVDNGVRGRVGELELRNADTGGGYLEYGLGAARKINDTLSLEGKATFRSGSGTRSYGGHVGFAWQF